MPVKLVTRTDDDAAKCVHILEKMLDRARAGEVTGIAIATTMPDASTGTIFIPGSNIAALIGACERVKLRLLQFEE